MASGGRVVADMKSVRISVDTLKPALLLAEPESTQEDRFICKIYLTTMYLLPPIYPVFGVIGAKSYLQKPANDTIEFRNTCLFTQPITTQHILIINNSSCAILGNPYLCKRKHLFERGNLSDFSLLVLRK